MSVEGFSPSPVEVNPEKREDHQFDDLTIFTTTFYGSDPVSQTRQKLAEQFLSNANNLGVRTVVVDGGSNPEFLESLKQFKNVHVIVESKLSMGESRRRALHEARQIYKTPFYLWAEPEKSGLITPESLQVMISGLRGETTDIIVPARKNFESLPKFQKFMEKRANQRVRDKLMPDTEVLDLWFGPKMFNNEGAEYFENYKGTLDKWDSIIKPVLEAHQAGKRVSTVEVDYEYDPTQKNSEEGDREMKRKRFEQYIQILAELGDSFWKEQLDQRERRKK